MADGKKAEALGEFRSLLQLNASGPIWEEAGSLLLNAGEYELAREFLQRAAKERPSARVDLTIVISNLDGPEAALRFLNQIPEKELNGDTLLLKANLLEEIGRKEEAEDMLDRGLHALSVNPQVVQQAVLTLLRLGRTERALNLLEQAMRANPQDSDLPLTKAMALGMIGRRAEAETQLREIELRWPEWDRAYLAHGLLLERAGQPAEARRRLQTAVALGSQDPSLRCALARLGGSLNPAPECACLTGLEPLLLSGCAVQP